MEWKDKDTLDNYEAATTACSAFASASAKASLPNGSIKCAIIYSSSLKRYRVWVRVSRGTGVFYVACRVEIIITNNEVGRKQEAHPRVPCRTRFLLDLLESWRQSM